MLERKPKGCVKAGEMLDTYEQARRKEGGPMKQRQGVKEVETLQESEKAPRDTPVRRPEQRSFGRGPRCLGMSQASVPVVEGVTMEDAPGIVESSRKLKMEIPWFQ